MNHKPFGGRIAALFLALAAAVLMASPVFANWCTHVYGSRHAYLHRDRRQPRDRQTDPGREDLR